MMEFCAHCGKELISEICDCQSVKDEIIQSQAEESKDNLVVSEDVEQAEDVENPVIDEQPEEAAEELEIDEQQEEAAEEPEIDEQPEDVENPVIAEQPEEAAEEPEVAEQADETVEESEPEEENKHPEEESKMYKLAAKVKEKAKEVGKNCLIGCKNTAKKIWEYDKKVGRKMLDILISPASEIQNADKELAVSITIGAIFIVFIFITHMIDPLFIGYQWDITLKATIALWLAMIPLATIFMATAIVYLFSKKEGCRVAFEKILAAFCVASAPSTIFYIIGYVLGFKWSVAIVVSIFLAIVSWVLLSVEVASYILKERNRTYWVMFLIVIMTTIIVAVCGTEIVNDIVAKVLLELNAYIQEVKIEFKDIILEMINGLF